VLIAVFTAAATCSVIMKGTMLKTRRRVALLTAAALMASGVATVAVPGSPAYAHGAMQAPASRTYACYVNGLTSTGEIKPTNPACATAVAAGGTQPLYDWYGVLRSDGGGRTVGFVPDGSLCSGGNTKYAAYDAPGTDWPTTTVTAGSVYNFVYGAWVPHPGGFKLYVTKDGWNPNQALTWSQMESTPFATADPEPAVSDGAYRFSGTLPNKTGRHIIYSVWYRSDSQETFYGCSDVIFTGGSTASPTVSPSSASPSASSSPSLPPNTTCAGTATVSNSWATGFMGAVTIRNTGTTPMSNWYVSWTVPAGVTVSQGWNGTFMQSGTTVMVHAASWNAYLAPGASADAGFLGNGAANPTFTNVSCG